MYEPLRRRMLSWLKVPPEPQPPLGAPASLRVFRAGRNYYRLRMFGWGLAQAIALAGILFWTGVLLSVEHTARAIQPPAPANVAPATTPRTDATIISPSPKLNRQQQIKAWRRQFEQRLDAATKAQLGSRSVLARAWAGSKQVCVEIALILPPWVFPLVWVLKIIGFAVYLLQLAVTYVVRRLDYEMRWYLVTDRSLRLRHGVWVVWESTMSFANIQQVAVSQGPLQRLLGLANVKVESAGGGTRPHEQSGDDMHVGYFHSVTNAEEIRDLILERLRRFRESGLGDPDERTALIPPAVEPAAAERVIVALAPASDGPNPLLAAAREFAAEARALRAAVEAK